MRGHQALIDLRRSGVCPTLAFVDLVAEPSALTSDWQRWSTQAHLEVLDSEGIRRLDLRCLRGVTVMVGGMQSERVAAMHNACVSAGAKRVLSSVWRLRRGDVETVSTMDSHSETETLHG